MTLLDNSHTFSLTIGGHEIWSYLRAESLQMVEAEGAQVDTLTFELEDSDNVLEVTEWHEVLFTADDSDRLFGGYVVKAQPKPAPGGQHRIWTVACEAWITDFGRSLRVRKTYVNQTTKAIVADMFVRAELTGFDVTTHVATGATLGLFATTGAKLGSYLDALCKLNSQKSGTTWGWRVDAEKNLWLGPLTSDPASFEIAPLASCNWATSFPASDVPTAEHDATTIVNRVTVRGGTLTSDNISEMHLGDGSQTLFALDYKPVRDVVSIELGASPLTFGIDWYNEYIEGYDVLVNYASGTVRFADDNAPAAAAELLVVYRYDREVNLVVTDAASFARYGRWFDAELVDAKLTSEEAARDAAIALLAEYAAGTVSGNLTVARLGIHAGQLLTITFPLLGLAGAYAVRQLTLSLDGAGTGVKCELRYGGHGQRLSSVLGGGSGVPAYGRPTTPPWISRTGLRDSLWVGRRDGHHVGLFSEPAGDGQRRDHLQVADHANRPYLSAGALDLDNDSAWLEIGYHGEPGIRLENGQIVIDNATLRTPVEPALTTGNLTAAAPLVFDNTRQVIGGGATVSMPAATAAVAGYATAAHVQALEAAASAQHAALTLDANADTLLSLTGQAVGLDAQAANTVLAGPTSGAAAAPTARLLVADDIPTLAYALGPATNSDGYVPQWDGANSKALNNGLSLVTTVGDPGADTALPTEQAVREAIAAGGGGAPTNADYVVETAQAGLSAEVVLGTTVISTAARASRQAAAKAGRLYLPGDGFTIERDTGVAWAPWGPLFPLTAPPAASGFAWANQGAAAYDETYGGLHLSVPAGAGENLRILKLSAPGTPYTVTALFLIHGYAVNYHKAGLCWRQSSDGKIVIFHLGGNGVIAGIGVQKYSSATMYSATYVDVNRIAGNPVWLRFADDGTDRICSWSMNGQHFLQLHSVGRTDFLTADEIGIFGGTNNAAYPLGVTLLSWRVT